jgi:hypothetical protein
LSPGQAPLSSPGVGSEGPLAGRPGSAQEPWMAGALRDEGRAGRSRRDPVPARGSFRAVAGASPKPLTPRPAHVAPTSRTTTKRPAIEHRAFRIRP